MCAIEKTGLLANVAAKHGDRKVGLGWLLQGETLVKHLHKCA